MRYLWAVTVMAVLGLGTGPAVRGESATVLLEKGIYTEETKGDPVEAMKIYKKIIADAQAERPAIAKAYLRLGMCYQKNGETGNATKTFEKLIAEFPEQKELVAQARKLLPKPDVSGIVRKAVTTISTCAEGDPKVWEALSSLKGLDETAVVKDLVPFLDSDMPTIRRSAIYILWRGGLKDITPATPKLLALCGHREEFTRGMAAIALGAGKYAPGFDALAKMAVEDKSGYARRCAVYALGLLGLPKARPILEKALEDRDPLVQANAQAALRMLGQSEPNTATMTQEEFPEIVGCRLKKEILVRVGAGKGGTKTPGKMEIFASDLPAVRGQADPEIAKKAKVYVGVVKPAQAPAGAKDGSVTRVFTEGSAELQPLSTGEYQVTVLVYEKKEDTTDASKALGSGAVALSVKPAPRTQIGFDDIQPDGKIDFSSIQQNLNSSSQTWRTTGFVNSDFVQVVKMTDCRDRALKMNVQHEGDIYRYQVTLNEPVPPGQMLMHRSEGYITRLVQQIPGTQDQFMYQMTHTPGGNQPTRRVEVYKLPKGAEVLDTTPSTMLRRERNGRIELCNQKMIPLGGSITTAFRYRIAGKTDQLDAERLTSEGWRLWTQGKFEEAEKTFQQAVDKDPDRVYAWNGLGWARMNLGMPQNAKEAFEKGLAANPKDPAAPAILNGLGQIAKGQGNTQEAIGYWEQAVQISPNAGGPLRGLAETYKEMKQYDKAARYYKMWIKAEPGNTEAVKGLLEVKQKGGITGAGGEEFQGLIDELSKPKPGDRPFAALNKIVEIGKPAVPALIAAMKTSDNWQIPKALGAIGDPRAVEPLIEKREKSNWSPMREVIVEALEKLTGKTLGTEAQAWRKWWQVQGGKSAS